MANVYEIITANIIKELESGNIPWLKPWNSAASAPRNFISGKAYRGVNTFILAARGFSSPYWLTFKQARLKGGVVRRGEKGTAIIFWKFTEEKDGDGKEIKKALLRYYMVFNAAQVDGVDFPAPEVRAEFEPLDACEKIIDGMRAKHKSDAEKDLEDATGATEETDKIVKEKGILGSMINVVMKFIKETHSKFVF